MSKESEILTIEEAAEYLKLNKRSVYKLAKEGKIPCNKVLHRWRFKREALRKWIAGDKFK